MGGHRLLVKQLLDPILELVRLLLADVLQPRPVMGEARVRHRGRELAVIEPVELEHEEQEMRRSGGNAVLHVAIEFGARRIDRIAGMDQARIGNDPADEIIERLITLDRSQERGPSLRTIGERRELALVGFLERQAFGVGAIEIAGNARIVEPGIEVGQVPFRQAGEAGAGLRLGLGGGLGGGGTIG